MLKEDSPNSGPLDRERQFSVGVPDSLRLHPQSDAMTAAACVAGLLIPGLGHVLLKRPVRGGILFVSILLMFVIGLGMQGQIYQPPAIRELISFNTLGAFANAGGGLLYVLALKMNWGVGLPTAQTFDYGWAYLLVAGLMNYLVVLDVFDIARGRKP